MPGHDIIAIGASAGGVEALQALVRWLPRDLPAALFVVLHVPPDGMSVLPQILSRAGELPAAHAMDGEPIVHGRIYIAPPDHHLIVERDAVRVTRGPRENRARPAVDPLFRSAALAYGPRVVSVILSGSLDDGTAGSMAVKQRGGISVVQDPDEALFVGMPTSALTNDRPDYCLPIAEISALLIRLASEPVPEGSDGEAPKALVKEIAAAEMEMSEIDDKQKNGTPSVFGCPECGGVLWELIDGKMLRYRCRVGHAYSADSLLADQTDHLEASLWAALRALEEKAALAERLHDRSHERGNAVAARRFAEQAATAREHAATVRELLVNGGSAAEEVDADIAAAQNND
jgi:two-component system chemotaxis response regulator CheB